MNDSPIDWKAGDQAICINTGGWHYVGSRRPACGPKLGEQLSVTEVVVRYGGCQYLVLTGWPYGEYVAACFTKPRDNFTAMGILRSLLIPERETEDA